MIGPGSDKNRFFFGPLPLVQFEEDFNSLTEMWWWGPVGLSQTRPIPRSPDGDKKGLCVFQVPRVINFYCAVYHNDLSYNDSGQLEWVGVVSMVKWLG